MNISDLREFPSTRPPTPYGTPLPIERDLKRGSGFLPPGTVLRAVGWLGSQVPSTGDTPMKHVDKLFRAHKRGLVFPDGFMGWHDCEICTDENQHYPEGGIWPIIHWRGRKLQLSGHGHYLLRRGHVVYMSPALVLHYILDHHYRPPDEFLDALIGGSFLDAKDLIFVRDP